MPDTDGKASAMEAVAKVCKSENSHLTKMAALKSRQGVTQYLAETTWLLTSQARAMCWPLICCCSFVDVTQALILPVFQRHDAGHQTNDI